MRTKFTGKSSVNGLLTSVFEKSSNAESRLAGLEYLSQRVAILFLDLLYATSALYESILSGFPRK